MTIAPYERAAIIHSICAFLHLGSTVFIAAYGLQNNASLSDYDTFVDKKFFSYTDWGQRCYNAANLTYSSDKEVVEACPDEDTLFYINRQGGDTLPGRVNILLLALAFTTVSGMVHGYAAYQVYTREALDLVSETRYRLCYDYGVSAPIMLCVVNITFGANNVSGVIAAPLLLIALLVASYFLLTRALQVTPSAAAAMDRVRSNGGVGLAGSRNNLATFGLFAGLVMLYVVALLPTIVAVSKVGSVAPPGVVVFLCGMLLAFSSFIVPYCYELYQRRFCVFVGYAALSVIAKAMLHAFLAISVLQQRTLYLNFDNATATPPTSMADETTAYMIITIIPATGIVLFFFIYKTLNPLFIDNKKMGAAAAADIIW